MAAPILTAPVSIEPAELRALRAELFEFKAKWASELTRAEKLERELAAATKAANRERSDAQRQLKRANEYLEHIHELHAADTQRRDCRGCDGTGKIHETELCVDPSRIEPGEYAYEATCEDCEGTGKEW